MVVRFYSAAAFACIFLLQCTNVFAIKAVFLSKHETGRRPVSVTDGLLFNKRLG
jgi:hypothetical protein